MERDRLRDGIIKKILVRDAESRQRAISTFICRVAHLAFEMKKLRHSIDATGTTDPDVMESIAIMELKITEDFRETFGHEMIEVQE